MKVFISWSGEKSKAVALALKDWLPLVIQTIDPWMSKHDIEAGARWSKEVAGALSDTKFGIICLTKGNLNAPWILFEAGALSKTLDDTYVCPYLIDLEPVDIPSSPLTQFQAKRSNKEETFELVKTINSALKENALPEDRLKRIFDSFWDELKVTLENLPKENTAKSQRPIEDMIAETLEIVRKLSIRNHLIGDIKIINVKDKNKEKLIHELLNVLNDPESIQEIDKNKLLNWYSDDTNDLNAQMRRFFKKPIKEVPVSSLLNKETKDENKDDESEETDKDKKKDESN